jgi:hypothetical protein
MNDSTIVDLLTNSGLKVVGIDSGFIYIEDPACIFPAFDAFLHYAWIVIVILTGIMLFGWAVLYIFKGAKIDSVFHNIKSLVLIFAMLSLVKPIVDVVYGDNLFEQQCEVKQIDRSQVDELLSLRNKKLGESDKYILDAVNSMTQAKQDEYSSQDINDNRTMLSEFSDSDIVEIKFQSDDKSTVYITKTGIKIKRSDTISTAWKNNNPGNIRASNSMQWLGAIGRSNGWCVFASEQDGINAMKKLLMSKNYNHLTLRGTIYKWAPAQDNNSPERYTNYVSKTASISPDKPMQDMTDYELENMVRAMQKFEGWIPGTEQKL